LWHTTWVAIAAGGHAWECFWRTRAAAFRGLETKSRPVTGMPMITDADKLKCAQRELALRKRVYPNRVLTHRMKPREADREIAMMAAIVLDYELRTAKEELPLEEPTHA
jgi:hypothetical protein